MKHTFIGLVFILGCATGGIASQFVVPPARAETPSGRWEYFCGEGEVTMNQLNKAGAHGWELATMIATRPKDAFRGVDAVFCFKRRLAS